MSSGSWARESSQRGKGLKVAELAWNLGLKVTARRHSQRGKDSWARGSSWANAAQRLPGCEGAVRCELFYGDG